MKQYPSYSAAIRTLGKSGVYYDTLIHCLKCQTHPPEMIVVYVAEGFDSPPRVADEMFVHCARGMASQRAMSYEEVSTDYILLCDDDLFLDENSVSRLFDALIDNHGDCIGANVFSNDDRRLSLKLKAACKWGEFPSLGRKYVFRVRSSSNFSYAQHVRPVMPSQSCAGPCMLISKDVNNRMDYADERWLDRFPYASGQDQVFSYKIYKRGYSLLVHSDCGIKHLDCGSSHLADAAKADFNKRKVRYIIWYRTIFEPGTGVARLWSSVCFHAWWMWTLLQSLPSVFRKGKRYVLPNVINALHQGRCYVHSEEYKSIPRYL